MKWTDRKIILVLLSLVLLFFWRAAFLGEVFYFLDNAVLNFPIRSFFAQNLKRFRLPLWCPYIYSGFPLFAEGQAGPLYPPNLILYILLPPWLAYSYNAILHYFLAGLFMYLFLRVLSLQRISSFIGALAFMLSGFIVTHLLHINHLNTAVWLPLILFFMERGFKTGRRLNFVYAGLALGAQFLAGGFQTSLYILLALALYLLSRIVIVFWSLNRKLSIAESIVISLILITGLRGIPIQTSQRILLLLGFYFIGKVITLLWYSGQRQNIGEIIINSFIVLGVGFGIGAVQLIPTYELSKMSYRSGGLPYEIATVSSLPLKHLFTFLMPDFYGNHMKGRAWADFGNYWETCLYTGVFPFLLSIIAVALRRDKYTYIFGGFALLCWLLAMGANTPLYRLIYPLPGFRHMRIPSRFSYLISFWIAGLGALGFDHIIKMDLKRNREVVKVLKISLIAFSLIVAAFYLSVFLKEPHIVKAIKKTTLVHDERAYKMFIKSITPSVMIIILSAGLLALYFMGKIRRETFVTAVAGVLIVDLFWFGAGFNPTSHRRFYTEKPSEIRYLERNKDIFRVVLYPIGITGNVLMLYGIQTPYGWSPLCIKRYSEFLNGKVEFANPPNFQFDVPRAMELLNVKYILARGRKLEDDDFELVRAGTTNIYRNKNFLPRAFIAKRAKIVREGDEILRLLRKKDFIFEETVILEEEPELKLDLTKTDPNEDSKVEIVKYEEGEVVVKVDMSNDGFLVLSDTYYPGWKAYVDDEERRIYRANYILRAVPLKRGKHTVRFVYDPLSFKVGLGVTGLSFLAVISTVFLRLRRKLPLMIGFIAIMGFATPDTASSNEVGRANVALGKFAKADGAVNPQEAPQYAVDGDTSTKWCIDLFEIYHAGAGTAQPPSPGAVDNPMWNTRSFLIQYSLTAEDDWVTCVEVSNNPGDERGNITRHRIKPTPMRFVRLFITDAGADKVARIYEFKVWGIPTPPKDGITGKVVQRDGSPIPRAVVQAFRGWETIGLPVMTEVGGTFWIAGIPQGRYRLRITAQGYIPLEIGRVDVVNGRIARVNIPPLQKIQFAVDIFHDPESVGGLLKLYDLSSLKRIKDPIDLTDLSGVHILFVANFRDNKPYTQGEIEAVRKFVFEGGRLVLAGDTRVWRYYNKQPVDRMPLNQIASSFEIQFLSNSYDSREIRFQPHPAVEKLALEDVIEIAAEVRTKLRTYKLEKHRFDKR
jgi:hypothetical protein